MGKFCMQTASHSDVPPTKLTFNLIILHSQTLTYHHVHLSIFLIGVRLTAPNHLAFERELLFHRSLIADFIVSCRFLLLGEFLLAHFAAKLFDFLQLFGMIQAEVIVLRVVQLEAANSAIFHLNIRWMTGFKMEADQLEVLVGKITLQALVNDAIAGHC